MPQVRSLFVNRCFELLSRCFEFLYAYKKGIGILMVGHSAKRIESLMFNEVLYGYVTYVLAARIDSLALRYLAEFTMMSILSFIDCFAMLVFYDWAKKDWLGIETAKDLGEAIFESSRVIRTFRWVAERRIVQWAIRRRVMQWTISCASRSAQWILKQTISQQIVQAIKTSIRWILKWKLFWAFIVLNIIEDPFITILFLRKKENRYAGLSRREWRIFYLSVLFSNAYWTFRWIVLLGFFLYAWENWIRPLF